MEKVVNNSRDPKAIRQRMEDVRCSLDDDVEAIVEGVREMGDWRSYVRRYPWVSLGVAVVAGYAVAPRRSLRVPRDARTLADFAGQSRTLASAQLPATGRPRGVWLAFAGNLLLRGVSAYVAQRAGQYLATSAARPPRDNPA